MIPIISSTSDLYIIQDNSDIPYYTPDKTAALKQYWKLRQNGNHIILLQMFHLKSGEVIGIPLHEILRDSESLGILKIDTD